MSTEAEGSTSPQPTPEPTPTPTPTPTPEPNTPEPVKIVEGQGEAEKPAEGEKPATEPVAPVALEALKFPEGSTVDPELSTEFLSVINDDKLSRAELAQKLVDLQGKVVAKVDSLATEAFETQNKTWVDEVKADPDVGGDKLDGVLGNIAKLVVEYGSPEVNEILTATGAGNNIHIIKMWDKVARALNESGGHANGNPPPDAKSAAQRIFPSMK